MPDVSPVRFRDSLPARRNWWWPTLMSWHDDRDFAFTLSSNPAFARAWNHLVEWNVIEIAFFYELEARLGYVPTCTSCSCWRDDPPGTRPWYPCGAPFHRLTDRGYSAVFSAAAESDWLREGPRHQNRGPSISPCGRVHTYTGPPTPENSWCCAPQEFFLSGPPLIDVSRSLRDIRRHVHENAAAQGLIARKENVLLRWVKRERERLGCRAVTKANQGDRGQRPFSWHWLEVLDGGKPTNEVDLNQRRRAHKTPKVELNQRRRADVALREWHETMGRNWRETMHWCWEQRNRVLRAGDERFCLSLDAEERAGSERLLELGIGTNGSQNCARHRLPCG